MVIHESPPVGATIAQATSPRWAVARRWIALALFAAVAAATVVRGSWVVDVERFEDLVRSGEITHVRTDLGEAVDRYEEGARGVATVDVQWRRWGVPFSSEKEVRLRDAAALEAEWQAMAPDGLVLSDDVTPRPGGSIAETLVAPGWVVLTVMLLHIGTFARIISSAEPVLMTRWAWFWALWVPWVGALAFWLFGDGARWGEGRQKVPSSDPDRRVKGWMWALVWFGVPAGVGLRSFVA